MSSQRDRYCVFTSVLPKPSRPLIHYKTSVYQFNSRMRELKIAMIVPQIVSILRNDIKMKSSVLSICMQLFKSGTPMILF